MKEYAENNDMGIEEAARELRYAFEKTAVKAGAPGWPQLIMRVTMRKRL